MRAGNLGRMRGARIFVGEDFDCGDSGVMIAGRLMMSLCRMRL